MTAALIVLGMGAPPGATWPHPTATPAARQSATLHAGPGSGQGLAQVGALAGDELQVVIDVLDVVGDHAAERHLAAPVVRPGAEERLVGQEPQHPGPLPAAGRVPLDQFPVHVSPLTRRRPCRRNPPNRGDSPPGLSRPSARAPAARAAARGRTATARPPAVGAGPRARTAGRRGPTAAPPG